jgi:hypothetical protein
VTFVGKTTGTPPISTVDVPSEISGVPTAHAIVGAALLGAGLLGAGLLDETLAVGATVLTAATGLAAGLLDPHAATSAIDDPARAAAARRRRVTDVFTVIPPR